MRNAARSEARERWRRSMPCRHVAIFVGGPSTAIRRRDKRRRADCTKSRQIGDSVFDQSNPTPIFLNLGPVRVVSWCSVRQACTVLSRASDSARTPLK